MHHQFLIFVPNFVVDRRVVDRRSSTPSVVGPSSVVADEDIVAIYHSHVESPAFPSRTDVELAGWPDAAYMIVSLGSEPPEVKAFAIRDGKISRRELDFVD